MNETVAFIESKADVFRTRGAEGDEVTWRQDVAVDECVLTVTDGDPNLSVDGAWERIWTVHMSKLDPSRVEIRPINEEVQAATYASRKLVTGSYTVRPDTAKYLAELRSDPVYQCSDGKCVEQTGPWWNIHFEVLSPAEVNMPKAARALSHLIKLCGGKEELF